MRLRLGEMFPDNDRARAWLEKRIWPEGPHFPHCGSVNVQCGIGRKTMTHRCRDCSNRPHCDQEITCKSAWHLAHRLRAAFGGGETPLFHGPVGTDEACFGGKTAIAVRQAAGKRVRYADLAG